MLKAGAHLDVPPVALQGADPVAHVGVPVELHVPQVPHLHVSVVVAGSDHPLCERVRAVTGVFSLHSPPCRCDL